MKVSNKCVLTESFQVVVRTTLPDWYQLCLKELNPCDPKKGLIPLSREKE